MIDFDIVLATGCHQVKRVGDLALDQHRRIGGALVVWHQQIEDVAPRLQVKDDDAHALLHQPPRDIGADEARASGDEHGPGHPRCLLTSNGIGSGAFSILKD